MADRPPPSTSHLDDSWLQQYANRTLPPAARAVAKQHLASCKLCRARLDDFMGDLAIEATQNKSPQRTPSLPPALPPALPSAIPTAASSPTAKPPNLPKKQESVVSPGANDSGSAPKQKTVDEPLSELVLGDTPVPTAATAPQATASDMTETLQLPQYEILSKIGRGGMGAIYLAQHQLTHRQEVVKVIHPNLVGRDDVRRFFLREIQNAARLDHPNVVKTYSAFEHGASLGLVMEHVPGITLSEYVKKNGPLPMITAIELVGQAAAGLAHAHDLGMVHRDIKPSNLMLVTKDRKHQLKILDFGLAKSTSETVAHDAESGTLGTPSYISPEQAVAPSSADTRADIYSLGCTFFFMLTGKPPCKANSNQEMVEAHKAGRLIPLQEAVPQVDSAVLGLWERMTAYSPDNRFQSPQEVIQAVRRCLDHLLGLGKPAASAAVAKPVAATNRPTKPPQPPGIKLPKNRPAHTKKPKQDSLFRSLVAAAIPLVFFGIALWFKTPAEWVRLVRGVQGAEQSENGSILLGQIPSGVEVYVDGYPARFERLVAGEPPQIAAKPGSYLLSFRKDGREFVSRKVSIEKSEHVTLHLDLQQELDTWASRGSTPAKDPLAENRLAQNTGATPKDPTGANGTKTDREMSQPKPVEPTPPVFESIDALLAETHRAVLAKDTTTIATNLAKLSAIPGNHPQFSQAASMASLIRNLQQYRSVLRDQLSKLRSGETLSLTRDDKVEIASVVEASASNLSIRLQGKNYRFESDNLPATVIEALLSLALPNDVLVQAKLRNLGILFSDKANAKDRTAALANLRDDDSDPKIDWDGLDSLWNWNGWIARPGSAPDSTVEAKEIAPSLFTKSKILKGSDQPIQAVLFLPNNRVAGIYSSAGSAPLSVLGETSKIKVWGRNGATSDSVETGQRQLLDLSLSSNGGILGVTSGSELSGFGVAAVIEKTKAKLLEDKSMSVAPLGLAFSKDNKTLGAIDTKGTFRKWNLRTGKIGSTTVPNKQLGSRKVVAAAYASDMEKVAMAMEDGALLVWETDTGDVQAEWSKDGSSDGNADWGTIKGLRFQDNNKRIVVLDENALVYSLSLESKEIESKRETGFGAMNKSRFALGSDRYVAVLGSGKRAGVIDLEKGTMVDQICQPESSALQDVAVADDGGSFAIGYADGSIQWLQKE